MMMSGKDFLKSHVLSWRRKVYSDWEDVTSSGRAFQVFEPTTEKARLLTVDRWHQKTIGACRTKRPSVGVMVVKMGLNAPKLSPLTPWNRHKFTKFLPELWSLAAGTLFQGLESWDSVGDQSLLVSLLKLVLWLQMGFNKAGNDYANS